MTTFTPKNILVTGGAGFIGANFIHHLLNQPQPPKVVNLDALTYAACLDNLSDIANHENYTFIQGDINDRLLVDKILREHNIDTIVHFAAESHVDRSISGPATFIQTNLVGTFNLLEAARQYWIEEKKWTEEDCLFHHISTDEVYGSLKKDETPFSETTAYAPNSPYSASKAGSDHLIRAYFKTYGLPTTTTNCSNNYGPFQHQEKFIPTIIHACLNEKTIPIYGDGSNIRDWLYVEDHCKGIETVIKTGKRGETYNIGGDNEWSNLEIAKKICELMNKMRPGKQPYEELMQFVQDRPGHDWRYAIDAQKIETMLHWQPKETFETGIVKTIEYYLKKWSH